ncbi:MAG: type II toxin-antitoxin system RelE/ParE family toxin [Flavobacteriales bacterium]
MKSYKVIVSKQAQGALKDIVEYIALDSVSASRHVKRTLISLIKSLQNNPEKFSKEELLSGKKKNYRSVSKWHYKVVYVVAKQEVIVLDIIHTSRNPNTVKKID